MISHERLTWFKRGDAAPSTIGCPRILIFSPNYPEGHSMRFRIIDGQFWGNCIEATHWAQLEGPQV
jgi:hypothetical protein